MKKPYDSPEMQVSMFDDEDVITASGPDLDDNEMPIL